MVLAAPEVIAEAPALIEGAGTLLSRGAGFLGRLFGGGGGKSVTTKVGESLVAHDVAGHIEQSTGIGNPGGTPSGGTPSSGGDPQHQQFGTSGINGVPANLSSSQFNGV